MKSRLQGKLAEWVAQNTKGAIAKWAKVSMLMRRLFRYSRYLGDKMKDKEQQSAIVRGSARIYAGTLS